MPHVQVNFVKCIQDSQDFGSTDDHMVSRVYFTVSIPGRQPTEAHVDVKQPVGSDFETCDLEVGPPEGYPGLWNHEAFRSAVEEYYRKLVGRQASVVRAGGSASVRMRNNTFVVSHLVEFDVSGSDAGW